MDKTDAVMDLAKRRGFLYPAFEIYGGMAGFYDYGPLGAGMKRRFEELWRHVFVRQNAIPMAEVACPRVTMPDVLKASGHVDEFTDLVVVCGQGHPARADHLVAAAGYEGNADTLSPADIDDAIGRLAAKCPTCGDKSWSKAQPLNLMNATEVGPGSGRTGYLRPETAQGIFTDFPHLLRYFRGKLPFAGVQVGGSNRNEISPRQGMLRLREFHMMECEAFFEDTDAPLPAFEEVKQRGAVFVPSATGEPQQQTFAGAVASGMVRNESLAYFLAKTQEFLVLAGMDPEKLRFRQHEADEMAHYAQDCWDAEFHSERYGWIECVGIADRGCFDLEQHAKHSGRRADFQVAIDLPTPVVFEGTQTVPDLGMLGRTFKARAKRIAAAMQAANEQAIKDAAAAAEGFEKAWLDDELVVQGPKDDTPAHGPLVLDVDGDKVEVPAEAYKVRSGTWTVGARKAIPRVIEPSFGVDRILYALWEHALDHGEKNGEPYTVLRLSRHVAPLQVAVLPLTNKDGLPDAAKLIETGLRQMGLETDFDVSGNIGRRYARQDEVGTPFCITVDNDTQADGMVTVRDRDTTEQERVDIQELPRILAERFSL